MRYAKRSAIAALVLLMLVYAACTDAQLTKLSQALNDVATANSELVTAIIAANKQGAISDNDTEAILKISQSIIAAGKQATALTRNLTKLAPADRTGVLNVLKPVIAAVAEAVNNGTAGIKNPDTKARVQQILVLIQTGLNSAQLILASGGAQ